MKFIIPPKYTPAGNLYTKICIDPSLKSVPLQEICTPKFVSIPPWNLYPCRKFVHQNLYRSLLEICTPAGNLYTKICIDPSLKSVSLQEICTPKFVSIPPWNLYPFRKFVPQNLYRLKSVSLQEIYTPKIYPLQEICTPEWNITRSQNIVEFWQYSSTIGHKQLPHPVITVVATLNTAERCVPELHRMVFGAGCKATASGVMWVHPGVPCEVIDGFTVVDSEYSLHLRKLLDNPSLELQREEEDPAFTILTRGEKMCTIGRPVGECKGLI